MSKLVLIAPLFALLAASAWFAIYSWNSLAGPPLPPSGYAAMAGGIVFSLLIGCGLMALLFYSSRHGYDDLSGGDEPRHRQ